MSDYFPENEELEKTPQIAEDVKEEITEAKEQISNAAEDAREEIKEEIKQDPAPADETYSYSFGRTEEPRESYRPAQPTRKYDPNTGAPQASQNDPYAYAPQGYYAPERQAQYTQQPRQYAPQEQFAPRQVPHAQYPPRADYPGYQPQPSPVKKDRFNKQKKKKSGALKAFLAVLLALCTILLGAAGGFLGNYIYRTITGKSAGGDTAVMYRTIETKNDGANMSVAAVADTVSNSVVEITTEYVTTGYFSFGQYVTKGAGSGVIVSDDGYIVTNNHVISDTDNGNTLADKIVVRLRTGEEYPAELVGRDADADIAVIKIDAKDLTAAVWGDSDALVVGEQIVVVGNPLGELGGTVTTGIISASDREIMIDETKMNLIQTDAAVNPGNSGGGMFNSKGELVGIVNAKSSGTGIEGLGFAIPSNDAQSVAEQLLEFGYVKGKTYIGVTFYEANSGGWFSSGGTGILYVYSCEEGYNDDVLKYGDQVVSVEGTAVSTKADVKAIMSEHEVGDKLTFTIIRNGKTMDVEVELFEYKPAEEGVTFKS